MRKAVLTDETEALQAAPAPPRRQTATGLALSLQWPAQQAKKVLAWTMLYQAVAECPEGSGRSESQRQKWLSDGVFATNPIPMRK